MTPRPRCHAIRRVALAGLIGSVLVIGAACGDPENDIGADLPTTASTVETTDTTDTTEPTDATEPTGTVAPPLDTAPVDGQPLTIDTLAADDLVLRVGLEGSNGSDEPRLVTVYADGTVVIPRHDSPTGFVAFQVDDTALGQVLALASDADLYGEVDYGEVAVTDLGSTVVTVHTDRGSTTVSVWALELTDGVTWNQADARTRLTALADALAHLQDDPAQQGPLEPFVPPTIELHLAPADPDDDSLPIADWPLADLRADQWQVTPWRSGCLAVDAAELAGVMANGPEQVWTLPATGTAIPPTVGVRLRALQPADEPCDGAPAFGAPRALTADESASTEHRVDTPWPADRRTSVHPLEAWAAESTLIDEVLPARLPDVGGWDRTRWSWFDVGVVGVELGEQRLVDVMATCTVFVEDEEPACTILARFDTTTGELVQFQAS